MLGYPLEGTAVTFAKILKLVEFAPVVPIKVSSLIEATRLSVVLIASYCTLLALLVLICMRSSIILPNSSIYSFMS